MTELNSKMNEVITKVLNISKRVKALEEAYVPREEYAVDSIQQIHLLKTRISTIEEVLPAIHGQLADLYATQKEPTVKVATLGDFVPNEKFSDWYNCNFPDDIPEEPKEAEEEIVEVEDLPLVEEITEETLKKLDEVID